jgi:hypothetical protein
VGTYWNIISNKKLITVFLNTFHAH